MYIVHKIDSANQLKLKDYFYCNISIFSQYMKRNQCLIICAKTYSLAFMKLH